jgi:ribosomal protein L40E
MTMPLMKPKKKNPVLRTRQMNLPPWARGRTALGMTAAAAEGRFELQVCQECGALQYPPREACHVCLSARLKWKPQDGQGELLSDSRCTTATTCSSANGCRGGWASSGSMPALP